MAETVREGMFCTNASCENASYDSSQFYTTAHVVESWLVDAEGNFIESDEIIETVHKPNFENRWTCSHCGKDAVLGRLIKVGDKVKTPRFSTCVIAEVLNRTEAAEKGFTEPIHFEDEHYDVFGKSIGENRIIFAAVRKAG